MSNEQECVRQIEKSVGQLKQLLHGYSTTSIAGQCLSYHLLKGNNPSFETRLSSPAKQLAFVLGILLESSEPPNPKELTKKDWETIETLLEEAFTAYLLLFIPTQEEQNSLPKEWHRVREVVMPTFLHFFNTGLIASSDQVRSRINQTLVPFDRELNEIIGISATQALEVCNWISEQLQVGADQVFDHLKEENAARTILLDQIQRENCSLKDAQEVASQSGYSVKLERFIASLALIGKINYHDLISAFPLAGQTFWQLFTIGRGEGSALQFPTDRSIADLRPLIRLSEKDVICPLANTLFSALLQISENALKDSPSVRDKYFKLRDRAHETNTLEAFRSIIRPEAELHSNVFETPDCQFEHDLVIVDNDICLIVESKASPPVEPFRDPDKAFARLRDAFKADTGIQKAYTQGMHLWRRLRGGESVLLYNEKGQVVTQLSPNLIDHTFCVCVTFHDFGPLATDLALLLEKKDKEPYPWALNVFDLEALGEAWKYFGWTTTDLTRYLRQRVLLHGKVFSDDELVFAGSWIQHGNFDDVIKAPADFISLNSHYSDIFDSLYVHLHQDGPPVEVKKTPPVLMDLGKSLRTGNPIWVDNMGKAKTSKVGRNDPCPCGSGTKYKKCHGR